MSDLENLAGITPRSIENLAKLNITTIYDLLFHLPIRYNDRSTITRIADISVNRDLQIIGHVYNARVIYGRRRMMTATLADASGEITLRFFHFSHKQLKNLADGRRLLCFGEPRRVGRRIEMAHPQYQLLSEHQPLDLPDCLEPVYATTKGLSQQRLQALIDTALDWAGQKKTEFEDVLAAMPGRCSQSSSILLLLHQVHKPPASTDKNALLERRHPAQQRLAFDELLAHHLSIMKIRTRSNQRKSHPLISSGKLLKPFIRNLPFELTRAQTKVLRDIKKDLSIDHPMMRLVQGDVGSGKTIVALIACLIAVENQHQAAIMAPTELLAEQHFRYFSRQLLPLGIQVAWLSSGLSAGKKTRMLELIASGTAAVVVGTHALFQDGVAFNSLAISITDEQHRFGVEQRLQLSQKGCAHTVYPHQLTMTATPIPRTLAMSMYAHLDYSLIDELPPGRKAIKTVAIAESRRDDIIERIRQVCRQGAQAYWVCSLIEESDLLQSRAATDTCEYLKTQLPKLTVGLLHGRLKSADKDTVMQDFIHKKINVLVATTVIEVGVDVANATLMIIENAERFGLAQLHQLRGRVGRGTQQSSCVLLYKNPLSKTARKRLQALRETGDGFALARIDLELRGAGEVLGKKQSGDMQMRIANVSRDMDLLPEVQKAARWLLKNRPQSVAVILRRWLGRAVEYANA